MTDDDKKPPDLSEHVCNPEEIAQYNKPCAICGRGPRRVDANGAETFVAVTLHDDGASVCVPCRIRNERTEAS